MTPSELLNNNMDARIEGENGTRIAAIEDEVATGQEDLAGGGQRRHGRWLRGHEYRSWVCGGKAGEVGIFIKVSPAGSSQVGGAIARVGGMG